MTIKIGLTPEEQNKIIEETLRIHYKDTYNAKRVPSDYLLMFTEGGESNAISYASGFIASRETLKSVVEWLENIGLSFSCFVITDDDYDWFWDNHDEEGWRCDRCGGDGFVEYIESPDLWGEDCPSLENHILPCPECERIERDMKAVILNHKIAQALQSLAEGEK